MTNRSSNKAAVPEAKGALDKFKYEVASEAGEYRSQTDTMATLLPDRMALWEDIW